MTGNDLHWGKGVGRETSSSFRAYSSCGKQRRLFKLWCLIHELMAYFLSYSWILFPVQRLWFLCHSDPAQCNYWCRVYQIPSSCWKQTIACVLPNLPGKGEQLRIQSTPHWCQACLLCHQLMVILRKELWWNLGIAKHLQMKDQSSRLRSRNFMKVKDQLLHLAIHPWNPTFYLRSMRIVWQQRPAKLVL